MLEPLSESADGFLSFRLHYLLPLTVEAQFFPPGRRSDLARAAAGRVVAPVGRSRRSPIRSPRSRPRGAELGDTFVVESGRDRYLFVFSPPALRAFYASPDAIASKGLADYRMLLRKLPAGAVRRRAHARPRPLRRPGRRGATSSTSITRSTSSSSELGDDGTFDAFALAAPARSPARSRVLDRRRAPPEPPWFDRLVADLDVLDGADAFVHPGSHEPCRAPTDKRAERAALARFEVAVGELLAEPRPRRSGFLGEIERAGTTPTRTSGRGHRPRRRAAPHRDDDQPVRGARAGRSAARAASRRPRPRRGG